MFIEFMQVADDKIRRPVYLNPQLIEGLEAIETKQAPLTRIHMWSGKRLDVDHTPSEVLSRLKAGR